MIFHWKRKVFQYDYWNFAICRCDGSASFRGGIHYADTRMCRRPRGRRYRWTRCSRRPRPHARSTISRWRPVHCRESNDSTNKKRNVLERVTSRRRLRTVTVARTASRRSKRYSCFSNLRAACRSATIIPYIYFHQITGNIINSSNVAWLTFKILQQTREELGDITRRIIKKQQKIKE